MLHLINHHMNPLIIHSLISLIDHLFDHRFTHRLNSQLYARKLEPDVKQSS